jgi:hypothetical protein
MIIKADTFSLVFPHSLSSAIMSTANNASTDNATVPANANAGTTASSTDSSNAPAVTHVDDDGIVHVNHPAASGGFFCNFPFIDLIFC